MKRTSLIVIMCLASLVLGAQPATAKPGADRIPVSGVLVGYDEFSPGVCEATVDGGPVISCADIEWSRPFTIMRMWTLGLDGRHWWSGSPYLQGAAVVHANWAEVVNCSSDPCTDTGILWGTARFTPDAYPNGGWEGRFTFKITSLGTYGFSYSGPLVAEGFGELKGARLFLDNNVDGNVAPWDGSHRCAGYVLTSARG